MSKEVMYHCSLTLGRGVRCRRLFLKSVEWLNDQIIISFSDELCEVPGSCVEVLSSAMNAVVRFPSMQWQIHSSQVPGSAESVELYRDEERLADLYRKRGKKFLEAFLASRSEEVTPDA